MAEPAAKVEGARELAISLGKAPKAVDRALAGAHRKTARTARGWLRDAAGAGTPLQRRMAGGIGSSANRSEARISVRNTAGAPAAQGTFYGAKQWRWAPAWVGDSWQVATSTGGPYVINPTLADRQPEIEDLYLGEAFDAIDIPRSLRRR